MAEYCECGSPLDEQGRCPKTVWDADDLVDRRTRNLREAYTQLVAEVIQERDAALKRCGQLERANDILIATVDELENALEDAPRPVYRPRDLDDLDIARPGEW